MNLHSSLYNVYATIYQIKPVFLRVFVCAVMKRFLQMPLMLLTKVAVNEIMTTAVQPAVADWSAEPVGDWAGEVAVGEWGGAASENWG